jgi:hypothetical protein
MPEPEDDLPEGVVARIDVMVEGVRVNLREGMTAKDFADMLHTIADSYEQGTIHRGDTAEGDQ